MPNILTNDQKFLLGLLLEHNDTDKVRSDFVTYLYNKECQKYIDIANGNEAVIDGFLREQLMLKAEHDAAKALPLLGDEIIYWARSLGGRTRVKKETA